MAKKLPKNIAEKQRIYQLPQNIRETIPLCGIMRNGIVETTPGTFTRSYKLPDANFLTASLEDHARIYREYGAFMNSIPEDIRFQVNIFSHEIDKKIITKELKIPPQPDGFNKLRQDCNSIVFADLAKSRKSVTQDLYFTTSITRDNAELASKKLLQMDEEITKSIKAIAGTLPKALNGFERMSLLHDIYNQDYGDKLIDEESVLKAVSEGSSIKDIIGPCTPSFDFSNPSRFMVGDMYAQALSMARTSGPGKMAADYLSELVGTQNTMLISLTYEKLPVDKAEKLAKDNMRNVSGKISELQRKNAQDGYFVDAPQELQQADANAKTLYDDITMRDQRLYLTTFIIVVFAHTVEELEGEVSSLKQVSSKRGCPLYTTTYQQEFAFNQSLPLARSDMAKGEERLFTTEEASVFVPFSSESLSQPGGTYLGICPANNRHIQHNRLRGQNYNGLIFGGPGSGKSVTAKYILLTTLLRDPKAQFFVIDPQGEYGKIVREMSSIAAEYVFAPGCGKYLNPLDLDITTSDDEIDPIAAKADRIEELITIIADTDRLSPAASSVLNRCVKRLYVPYIDELTRAGKTFDRDKCPTLTSLYSELKLEARQDPMAGAIAEELDKYVSGTFDTFSKHTNVNTSARLIVYNTKRLGKGMRELGLFICMSDIYNRMIENSKQGIFTHIIIDEFHVLLESPRTVTFLLHIWKMARKWMGSPTGITQNMEDLMLSKETRAIFNTTSFIVMMNAPEQDRTAIGELLHLSSEQLKFITNAPRGQGLLYNGRVTIPFTLNLCPDKDNPTQLFKMVNTSPTDNEKEKERTAG
jgi:hypothetical protein